MKIRLVGDHSDYHCGSAAAFEVIQSECDRKGTIVTDDNFDLLVVNGEGSMHHDTGGCNSKIKEIDNAIRAGRRAMLVNTVWQENDPEKSKILSGCDKIVAREILSQQELSRNGIESSVCIDQSFFAPIRDEGYTNLNGQVAFTDFYSEEFGCFVRVNSRWAQKFHFVDMQRMSWSYLVSTLKTSSLLVTGRHHAVYAACRARTPFLALSGNTFKIQGLLQTANIRIPVISNFKDLKANLSWPEQNRDTYERLFDWMESQEPWRL